jgi:hypothetical protein
MMLVQEKKRHRQGCGPFAYDQLPARSLDEKESKRIEEHGRLTEDPASTLVRLIYVIPSESRMGARLRSAIEGSGVVIRKEEMYFVSAISRCSKIRSRSSTSKARRRVSLGQL